MISRYWKYVERLAWLVILFDTTVRVIVALRGGTPPPADQVPWIILIVALLKRQHPEV